MQHKSMHTNFDVVEMFDKNIYETFNCNSYLTTFQSKFHNVKITDSLYLMNICIVVGFVNCEMGLYLWHNKNKKLH